MGGDSTKALRIKNLRTGLEDATSRSLFGIPLPPSPWLGALLSPGKRALADQSSLTIERMTILSYGLAAVIVALVLAQIARYQPSLDLEQRVLPMAQQYTGSNSLQPLLGQRILVTGATSGIGCDLVKVLHRLGAEMVVVGRSRVKLDQLEHELGAKRVIPIQLDLSDLDQVSLAVERIIEIGPLDTVVANAGFIYWAQFGQARSTAQGWDQCLTVNYLSHALIIERLLRSSQPPTRIVHVSSLMHFCDDGSALENLRILNPLPSSTPLWQRIWHGHQTYAASKLAQILYSNAVARRYPVQATAVSPGWVATSITGHNLLSYPMSIFCFSSRGWGLASILEAIFANDPSPYYINTSATDFLMRQVYERHLAPFLPGVAREMVGFVVAGVCLLVQKAVPDARAAASSLVSRNTTRQDHVYETTLARLAPYL